MSYDIDLCDPVSGEVLMADDPHHMAGGTYSLGGTRELTLSVTYNYGRLIREVLHADGLPSLSGRTAAETIGPLKAAAERLGDGVSSDYWEPTEGNVKRALYQLIALAHLRPDGIWRVT